MKIGIIGLGFVGLSFASVLASKGYSVIGVDTENGTVHAGLIVLSTGPWIKDLTDPLNIDTYLDISRHSVITLKSDSEYDFKFPVIKDLSTENKMYFRRRNIMGSKIKFVIFRRYKKKGNTNFKF